MSYGYLVPRWLLLMHVLPNVLFLFAKLRRGFFMVDVCTQTPNFFNLCCHVRIPYWQYCPHTD